MDLAARYGYDRWLVGRFLEYVPDLRPFLDKMKRPPAQYIRVNTLKTSREELEERLSSKGFELKRTCNPGGACGGKGTDGYRRDK